MASSIGMPCCTFAVPRSREMSLSNRLAAACALKMVSVCAGANVVVDADADANADVEGPSHRSPLAQFPRPRHSLQCLVCRSRPLIHPRCSHVNVSRRWCRCGWRRPCAIGLVQVPLDRHHGASQATASPRRIAHCKGAAEDQVCGQATCSLLCIGC